MGSKRALGGGLAMVTAGLASLLVVTLLWAALSAIISGPLGPALSGAIAYYILPIVVGSNLVAGVLVWWFLPRGWKYGAVGGGFASAIAYPISAVFWTMLGTYGGFIGDLVFVSVSFIFTGFITLPVGVACGVLYEKVLERHGGRMATVDAEKPTPSDRESRPNS